LKRRVKLLANAKLGRIGMELTKGQAENQGHQVHEPAPSL
jgi:hypothetical protein